MKNIILEIEHISEDQSLRYKLIYLTGKKLRGKRGDKTLPIVTQCLLFRNDLLVTFGQVVKCDSDIHNPAYALKIVTKKVMEEIWFKQMRKPIWDKLFYQLQFIKS